MANDAEYHEIEIDIAICYLHITLAFHCVVLFNKCMPLVTEQFKCVDQIS